MAATESNAGNFLKGETAATIQRVAGTEVVRTARDYWGDQHVSVRHRGCTVHWGPENSKKYLEVVLAATREVAAGTTVEAAADTIRAHVVDAIGEERLEPATAEGATTESESTELGEEATAEATRKKKQEKDRTKKQRRRQRMQAAAEDAVTDAAVAGEEIAEKAAVAAKTTVAAAIQAARATMTSAEEAAVDAAGAAEAAEESMVAAGAVAAVSVAAAAVSAEATDKSAQGENHAVWSDHIAENKKMAKMAATIEEATGDPAVAGEAAVGLVEAAEAVSMEKAALSVGGVWEHMWWWVNKEWAEAETEAEQNMLIDFRWEAVGQRSTGWWWQKHSWNQWRQVVTAGKAVAATEEAAQATGAAQAAT
jgi:hypothetical protein